MWNLHSGECDSTLSGHRKPVTALRFSRSGALLASGSKDTDVVVWDVAAEAGLFRLRGHKDQASERGSERSWVVGGAGRRLPRPPSGAARRREGALSIWAPPLRPPAALARSPTLCLWSGGTSW